MSLEIFFNKINEIKSYTNEHRALVHKITAVGEIAELKLKLNENTSYIYVNLLERQLAELKKLLSISYSGEDEDLEEYHGTLIYFPWKNVIAHILDETDFVFVRTSRNRNKINHSEATTLSNKTLGIAGLSVGQTIASTIALERSVGKLILADFDVIDLSNLNRIRTSILNTGISKTIVIAREIAEIDPFIEIEILSDGITESNINEFVSSCDLIVDECDDIEVKIKLRQQAKLYRKPLVMDTSDDIFIDIERYDTDPDYPIFHGLVDENELYQGVNHQNRNSITMKILEFEKISSRGQESILEIGKSLLTWPQLASDVVAGGGCTSKIIREILLNKPICSQRFRFDLINHLKKSKV